MSLRLISLLLSVFLIFSAATTIALSPLTNSVTVSLSLSESGLGFHVLPQNITVQAQLSDTYGYEDLDGGVSVLDAMIKLITLIYGDDPAVVAGKLSVSGNMVTDFMGNGANVVALVNGEFGDLGFNETLLNDGERLEVYLLKDDWGADITSWFEYGEEKTENITVNIGEEFKLKVRGSSWMLDFENWPPLPQDLDDAEIVIVTAQAQDAYQKGVFDETIAVTDKNGEAYITFSQAGSYILSLNGELTDYALPVIPAFLLVTVKDHWDGAGTETNPYLLSTKDDLSKLSDFVGGGNNFSDKYFKLTQDIELDGDWVPIGVVESNAANSFQFAGCFDGGGYTLSFASGSMPLFKNAAGGTVIKNLNIYGEYIADFGLIAGFHPGSNTTAIIIDNCTIKSGTTIKKSGFVGDPAAYICTVDIRNCTVESGVRIGYDALKDEPADAGEGYPSGAYASGPGVGSFVSGLCGSISNCVSYATVYGQNQVGGIAGYKAQSMRGFEITNSIFGGEIIASGDYIGGIVGGGYNHSSAGNAPGVNINNCYVTGDIQGNNYVGGIVGGEGGIWQVWNASYIRNNHFAGNLSALADEPERYVGGIIGYMKSLNIYTIISNNYYLQDSGAERGIGYADFVDTSYEIASTDHTGQIFNTANALPGLTQGSGWTVTGVTKTNHNREDDPMGLDANKLAKAVTAAQMADGTIKEMLNDGDGSLNNWGQGSNYPIHGSDAVVTELVANGYKEVYIQGEEFSTEGMTITALFSDGGTRTIDAGEVVFTGYDKNVKGIQEIVAAYGGVFVTFQITIQASSVPEDLIYVYFSLYGDSIHQVPPYHTLQHGGLSVWIPKKLYAVPRNSTVLDIFTKALNEAGFTWKNKGGNYIESITNDGFTLSEFDNGPLSGWMFTLNEAHPLYGVAEQSLSDGDRVVFHYSDDYTKEEGGEYFESVPVPGANSSIPSISQEKVLYENGAIELEAAVKDSIATAVVDSDIISGLAYQSKDIGLDSVVFIVTDAGDISGIELELGIDDIKVIADNELGIILKTTLATVKIDRKTIEEIAGRSENKLKICINILDLQIVPSEDDDFVFELMVLADDIPVQDMGVFINIPYAPPEGLLDYSLLAVYSFDESNGIQELRNAEYDAEASEFMFSATRLSLFFISEWINPFSDVTESSWYYNSVRFVYGELLMRGSGGGLFEPGEDLTRAMLIQILYNLEGCPEYEPGAAFEDVKEYAWYYDAVTWAGANAIAVGKGNGLFAPDENITREQFAVILYNYTIWKNTDVTIDSSLTSFSDANEISSWAYEAMEWATASGIINGRSPNTLAPLATATRAEAAAIFMNFSHSLT